MALLKSHAPIDKEYDVIIIGGGLGGMTAANILGRNGHHVLLLEAHNKLGGFATWFYRQDREHVFDISLHGFPYGMIKTCRKYWSKEIAEDIVQLKDVRFINPQFQLQTEFTKEDFSKKLEEHFHISPETVAAFFQHLSQMNFYDQNTMTNRELFDHFFPGRNDVVRFLMEPITYANGSTLDDPAISYGIVFSNFMSKGVYTFKGGTDQLILKMRNELLKNNVDIRLQTKVEKIQLEGDQVTSVLIKDQEIKTKVVLSNAHLMNTLFELLPSKALTFFPEQMQVSIPKIRSNSSSCQVYLGFKKDFSLPHMGDLIFTSTHPTYVPERLLDFNISSRTFSIYYPSARPQDPEARVCIVSSTNSHFEDWKKLSSLEYETEKQKMIDETIDALEKIIPNARDFIEIAEAATPLTIQKFTHHYEGSSFGTKFEGLPISMNLPKYIKGLFHAGSVGIIMSGWLGAANYGVIVANQIESYLYQQGNKS